MRPRLCRLSCIALIGVSCLLTSACGDSSAPPVNPSAVAEALAFGLQQGDIVTTAPVARPDRAACRNNRPAEWQCDVTYGMYSDTVFIDRARSGGDYLQRRSVEGLVPASTITSSDLTELMQGASAFNDGGPLLSCFRYKGYGECGGFSVQGTGELPGPVAGFCVFSPPIPPADGATSMMRPANLSRALRAASRALGAHAVVVYLYLEPTVLTIYLLRDGRLDEVEVFGATVEPAQDLGPSFVTPLGTMQLSAIDPTDPQTLIDAVARGAHVAPSELRDAEAVPSGFRGPVAWWSADATDGCRTFQAYGSAGPRGPITEWTAPGIVRTLPGLGP